ncbi:MAG: ATP-binding protein [Deltaproteobacteria bacterium]|nr:ATP-binding protein [Deltaproteobacteria bacterium]
MFRLKIILLSLLISGSVLVSFGLYFLDVVAKVSLERIDREILTVGEGQIHLLRPRHYWQELDQSLRYIYGSERAQDIIVQVKDVDDAVLYQSAHWPQDISETAFPEFDHALERFAIQPPPMGPNGPAGEGPKPPQPPEYRLFLENAPRAGKPSSGPAVPLVLRRPGPALSLSFRLPPLRIKQPVFKTLRAKGKDWRVAIMGNQYVTLILGFEMGHFYADAARFQKAFLITIPIALLLLGGGGWLLTDRALRPIALITRTAESITAQGLARRIPSSTGSSRDLARLVEVINAMLDRLEKSFHQALRFSADAAHELKTPLTILQGILDDAVQQSPLASEEQRRYSALLEEVERLKAIVQKLLILAHADAGKLALQREPVDVSALVEAAIEDVGAMAPRLHLEAEVAPQIAAWVDPDLFKQVILNLTSNAVKYNRAEGTIRFYLQAASGRIHFTIANTGSAIPEEDREKIFHRFYRVDKSRSNAISGTGLGLSLAREIIHAHGGTLKLDAVTGEWVSFTLTLPSLA